MFERASVHGQWSSGQIFFLAVVGSAVGLGNIWKFPYITGENGGGAFVLVYLICLLLIGAPILIAETLIGRRGRQCPTRSFRDLGYEAGSTGLWKMLGFMTMLAGFLILTYYSVVSAWVLAYLARSAAGTFVGINQIGADQVYQSVVTDPEKGLSWHTLFMVTTMFVVARGVDRGLEWAIKLMLPLLLVMLLMLVGFAAIRGDLMAAFQFLFHSDFSALTTGGLLSAMGHALFTLGLGVGAVIVYGAYLPGDVSIPRAAMAVILTDTLIALLAGLAVFAMLFATGFSPDEGPGLIFLTLPLVFGHMPGGQFFSMLFFAVLAFAALTSAIALLEPTVAWIVEKWNTGRIKATIIAGSIAWLIGIACLLSFAGWSFEFELFGQLRRHGWFDVIEVVTASLLLPLNALLIVIFIGWTLLRDTLEEELNNAGLVFRAWYFTIRFITPVAVVAIFLQVLGVF